MNENIIIAILSSSVVSTIISAIIGKLKDKSTFNKALVSIMGMTIRKTCKEAIKDNAIPYEELKQLEDMNSLYQEMGGNGFVKTLMSKVEKLPIVEE